MDVHQPPLGPTCFGGKDMVLTTAPPSICNTGGSWRNLPVQRVGQRGGCSTGCSSSHETHQVHVLPTAGLEDLLIPGAPRDAEAAASGRGGSNCETTTAFKPSVAGDSPSKMIKMLLNYRLTIIATCQAKSCQCHSQDLVMKPLSMLSSA